MEYKKLAITGANGYLGLHTTKVAIQRGWDVVGIVRRDEAAKEVEKLGAKAIIIKNFDLDSLKEALRGCKAVMQFRGVVCGSKEIFEKVNIEGMRVLIEAALEENVSRIVFPSGLGVDRYGIEEWANNEYFRSKLAAEQLLKESKIRHVIFRPSYILGPNDELIPDLIDQIGKGVVQVAGTGNAPMQPIFVKNAVEAFLAAADGIGKHNQIYDLVGPKVVNMIDLIEMIVKIMVDLGFNVPKPRINHISYEEAPEIFGICKEMVDVMKSDVTSNDNITAEALGYKLSDLEDAVKAAVISKLNFSEETKTNSAIILLSGGIDSTTALYWAYNKGYDLIALSFNYHFRPENEKKAALKLAESLNIKFIEIPIPYIKEAIDLRIEGFPIPSAVYAPEGFIPARNLVFYATAAYFAEIYGCKYIIGGHITADPLKFPDTTQNFFKSLEKLINDGKHNKDKTIVKLLFPLENMTKSQVIQLAKELNVPLEVTWSCYSDGSKPCNECSSCRTRKKAFLDLNYADPEFSLS
ncbi:MAG: 7-cyano-7-deazaguanine synthase [Candidatus Hermodarchaeota archaeon]